MREKSRRIGATYDQSYEDVSDCVKTPNLPVWFSSADESAAAEYIHYCEQWTELFDIAGEYLGEVVLDSKKDIKAHIIRYANGARIHALSSNPKAFRSKGGKVVLDEFAFHDDPDALWKAARPCITWGFPMRIISTHNGETCLYFQLVRNIKEDRMKGWSHHKTDIYQAVEEGLVDKIMGRKTTKEEREEWLRNEKDTCFDEDTWLQEYCCIPVDEATAFLVYDLIRKCENEMAGRPEFAGVSGEFYGGIDIGRRGDLFIIWVLEKVGDVLWAREVFEGKKISFADQDAELDRVMRTYEPKRICMDQTGMGEKPVEDAKRRYGEYRVEGVLFTNPVKQELAFDLKRKFEDKLTRIPVSREIREDHHSIKKVTTVAGNIRFDAERSKLGHADRFWAHSLAIHAAGEPIGVIEYQSTGRKREFASSSMNNFIRGGH